MEILLQFVDFFLHLDKHLDYVFREYGNLTYIVLFVIILCETGLVVTPILPGDSLLFAAGAMAARGSLDVKILFISLFVAAVLGDALNYYIGYRIGPAVFKKQNSKIFRKEYLDKTHSFYEKYGGKTIIIARFVPIVRTFAPFLAGVGSMSYTRFALYNVSGALLWIVLFVFGGFYFGELEIVKKNFTLVILSIIVISLMPPVIEYLRQRKAATSTLQS